MAIQITTSANPIPQITEKPAPTPAAAAAAPADANPVHTPAPAPAPASTEPQASSDPANAVPTPAPAASPETVTAPAPAAEKKPVDPPAEDPKPRKPLIEELVKTRHERNAARSEIEQLRAELEAVKARQNYMPQEDPDPKPVRDKFASDDDYLEALTDWKADQVITQRQKQAAEAEAAAAQQRIQDEWLERVESAKKVYPDFADVVGNATIEIKNHIYQAIVESEVGPEVAYYLAQNPAEAQRLNSMSPISAVRMIGKLEEMLLDPAQDATRNPAPAAQQAASAPAPAPSAAPVHPTAKGTSAPEPINPIRGNSNPAVDTRPASEMTYNEWKARRVAERKSNPRGR